MRFSRREFLNAAVGAAAVVGAPRALGQAQRPNIVFILADDLGYANLGCYGSKVIQTPYLDRMAAEGMRFTDAYSGCTVCAPARSTLMTGKHMGQASVRGNTGGIPLPASEATLAEILRDAGYATGGFGKWGLGDIGTDGTPERKGFDVFFGYYHQVHAHDYYPEYLVRNGEKVYLPENKDGAQGRYSHHLIVEEMMAFIRSRSNQPFFCFAPWTPPHGSYRIPESEPAWTLYKDMDWPDDAKVIAAMDTMIDRHVGDLFTLLRELGIDDRTLVLFCSDNGAAERFDGVLDSCGPFRGYKKSMYEGGIRIPLLARWPGRITAGSVTDFPCSFPDMLPTLAELAGIADRVPTDVTGVSILPTLLGKTQAGADRHLYWEWPQNDRGENAFAPEGLMQAVRRGKWKLLRNSGTVPWELYDLSKDPGETRNLADAHPDVVTELLDWVQANRVDPRPQAEPPHPEGQKYN